MSGTKTLPSIVARAFATVSVTREQPCTYPNSKNPRWIYFLRPGYAANDLLLRAWNKYPFADFEPYIEPTGVKDSNARYWRLRKQCDS